RHRSGDIHASIPLHGHLSDRRCGNAVGGRLRVQYQGKWVKHQSDSALGEEVMSDSGAREYARGAVRLNPGSGRGTHRRWAAGAAGLLLLSTFAVKPALAHHSFAMFDANKCVRLTGTVKVFQWTFPHSWLWLVVPDGTGGMQPWGFEGLPPSQLVRETGWQRSWLKVGDN